MDVGQKLRQIQVAMEEVGWVDGKLVDLGIDESDAAS